MNRVLSPAGLKRRRALQITAAGVVGCLWNGFVLEPTRLSVTRCEIPIRGLSSGLDGLRVALLSDFHFRPGDDDELVDKVVRRVAIENPDLVALTGDYLSRDPGVVPPLLAKLKDLTARHGVFAVLGNHDGWRGDPVLLRRQFDQAGIPLLINQNTRLSIGGESLAVAGTDFVWHGKPDPERTLRGIPAATPVLALVHEPDYFDTLRLQRTIQLQLSGHTHGGQCRVPLLGWAPRKVDFGRNYLYGHFQRGDSNLFVTRGVGTVGVRVRFACPPELAFLTLRAAA